VHVIAAFLAFGGSGIAQVLYGFLFFQEDEKTQPAHAVCIRNSRLALSLLWWTLLASFLYCQLNPGHGGAIEPWEHIFEWSLWFCLHLWYFTFRWDLQDLYAATCIKEQAGASSHHQL